jgi:hypothetical protein
MSQQFIYGFYYQGDRVVIQDERNLDIVYSYYKISPSMNHEKLARIVFSAKKENTELDLKMIKKGIIKFTDVSTKDIFTAKFLDADGNNILSDIVKNIFGVEADPDDNRKNIDLLLDNALHSFNPNQET